MGDWRLLEEAAEDALARAREGRERGAPRQAVDAERFGDALRGVLAENARLREEVAALKARPLAAVPQQQLRDIAKAFRLAPRQERSTIVYEMVQDELARREASHE